MFAGREILLYPGTPFVQKFAGRELSAIDLPHVSRQSVSYNSSIS